MDVPSGSEVAHATRRRGWRLAGAVLLPAAAFFSIWALSVKDQGLKDLFGNQKDGASFPPIYVTMMMVFGSLVAGSTHQGSASIAFPVISLLLGASPVVARDFAFLIQSVGMTSATFSIAFLQVECDIQALIVCTLAGGVGLIFGLEAISPHLSTPVVHMVFVAISLSFAISLFWWPGNYREYGIGEERKAEDEACALPRIARAGILFGAGLVGGILSALFGAGLGTCAFAVLTHAFQVPEKVAVPTSVILMAVNTCIGALYRICFTQIIDGVAWMYFTVAVPVVAFGAPLGLVLAHHFGSSFMPHVVYIFHTGLSFVALILIKPWSTSTTDHPGILLGATVALIVVGVSLVRALDYLRSNISRYVSYAQLDLESQATKHVMQRKS